MGRCKGDLKQVEKKIKPLTLRQLKIEIDMIKYTFENTRTLFM